MDLRPERDPTSAAPSVGRFNLTWPFLEVSVTRVSTWNSGLKAFTCPLIDAGQRAFPAPSPSYVEQQNPFRGRTVNQAVHGWEEVLMQGRNGVHRAHTERCSLGIPPDQHQTFPEIDVTVPS